MDRTTIFGSIAAAWAVGVSAYGIRAQQPPPAQAIDAPAHEFAAARAHKHIQAIARAPHPMGSRESDYVRQTLVQKLSELDLDPEIQAPKKSDSPVRNVIGRLRGTGAPGKKALMLCAHYDSVPESPGAGDDAAGVAVIVETVRALKAGAPVERDLIVLFDDGEENGFHGARLFVDEHRWAHDVGVVLNFDARGNSGPSFMFETSDENGWLIEQLAAAIPQPLATSLSMDIYKIMPNNTDMSVFKRAGISGLNFAFGAGIAYYHTAEDTPANLEQSTLQHQGENALAMSRWLGNLDLDDTKHPDVIYTSILGRGLVAYPKTWVIPIALFTTGLFALVIYRCIRSGRMAAGDLAAGAGIICAAVVIALLVIGTLFLAGTAWITLANLRGHRIPWEKHDVLIMSVCALITVVVTFGLERLVAGDRTWVGLCLGALSWWLAFSLATAFWLPGASYLFAWPTLAGVLGAAASTRWSANSFFACVATGICAIPSLVLLPPLIRSTFDGLGPRMTVPIMILVVLFLGTMLPLLGPFLVPRNGARSDLPQTALYT